MKRRSKYERLAYALEILARHAVNAALIANDITPENTERINKSLKERIMNIKLTVELIEQQFAKVEDQS